MHINQDFLKCFDELEKGYCELRKKVNAFREEGRELEDRLHAEYRQFEPWRHPIMTELGNMGIDFDSATKKKHKEFVKRSTLHRIFQEAPYYWRIINKPEGYAGDAEMMNIIYRNRYEGETPFGMFVHKQAVLCEACQAVRNRKIFLYEKILQGRKEGRKRSFSV